LTAERICPKCGDDCWRESVDVGVGVIYGPYGCSCGWSEHEEYDSSDAHAAAPEGWRVTPQGVLINLERERDEHAAILARFGRSRGDEPL
jgi:hypothetical protein